ncbi:MAG: hypothetical protein WCT25_02475 [Candidatus Paceibacterota bacterium]
MRLTTQTVARFIGGQMEIQNPSEGYLYRGEIQTATVEESANELHVRFAWLAKGEGFPPLPKSWVNAPEDLDYSASLEIYTVSDIGPSGHIDGDHRLCLNSSITGETVILFPPNSSKLDPDKVKGLRLPEKVA